MNTDPSVSERLFAPRGPDRVLHGAMIKTVGSARGSQPSHVNPRPLRRVTHSEDAGTFMHAQHRPFGRCRVAIFGYRRDDD